jgi:hypothetical protein
MRTACSPAPNGIDIQCTAEGFYTGLYVCDPGTTWRLTDKITWLSADTSIAAFGLPGAPPGYLTVVGTGWVQVLAQYPLTDFANRHAFDVAPGRAAIELVNLRVWVQDAVTSSSIGGAVVTAIPDRSAGQTCPAQSTTAPACDFWMYQGTVTVSASATGYQESTKSFSSTPGENYLGVQMLLSRLH